MNDLILHHYPASPFAEKARLMIGYKKLAWQSVHIPMVMPKPDLLALTGGYRRTPVLQIGADIYCDTALIADVLEHVQPLPPLFPEPCKGLARTVAQWADSTLFWTALPYSTQPAGLAQMFANIDPAQAQAFGADRKAMAEGQTRPRPKDAAAAYKSYLRRLSDMLDDSDFLLGSVPSIADFAAYHPLWFTRVQTPALADILKLTPAVLDWMDRMAEIGHGKAERLTAQEAIEVARRSTPKPVAGEFFQDEHGIALGSRVSISAESFGTEATEGTLVAASRTHYVLRREDARAGVLHVHFPRIGYALKALKD